MGEIMSPHWKSIAAVAIVGLGVAVPARAALTISSQSTQGVDCASGVCTATAKNAVLNVGDLTNLLAGSDLSVESGKLAKDIVVAADLHLTSANMLTLDSARAMKHAVEAGRLAYLAGRMAKKRYADPSSPLAGLI